MRKALSRGVLEGLVGSFLMVCSATFLFLPFSIQVSPVLVGSVGAGVSVVVFFFLARKNLSNVEMICYYFMSVLSFALFNIAYLIIRISVPLDFLHLREGNSADSILLFVILVSYIGGANSVKIIILGIYIAKNIYKRIRKTGDGFA